MKSIYSIGALSKQTRCKIPTIRYYEDIGLLLPANRSIGNQRRYNDDHLSRLRFIRHSRALGFNLEEVRQLIHLQHCSSHSPHEAHQIAKVHSVDVQLKIKQLLALEVELTEMVESCDHGNSYHCNVLDALNQTIEE